MTPAEWEEFLGRLTQEETYNLLNLCWMNLTQERRNQFMYEREQEEEQ